MLGAEQQLVERYVASGLVQNVFSPVLNHGERSIVAHMANECAGDQDDFWGFREYLFEEHSRLWRGSIHNTVKELASEYGLDTVDFNNCIDTERHMETLLAQDRIRLEQNITFQPVFQLSNAEVGGFLIGSQPIQAFEEALAELGLTISQ